MRRAWAVSVFFAALCCAILAAGCGKPYYVEGQDEVGELPDSLRIMIEEREKAEEAEKAQAQPVEAEEGVLVRELGPPPEGAALGLEFSAEGPYRLRRGDKVEIDVLFYPELETITFVRSDGKLTAPGVGDVVALGRQPQEVAADIEAYYSQLLRDPQTTVNVVGFGERRAYVLGAVNRPGPVELQQRMTLTQAVAEVGSFDENAKVATVVLLRRKSENSAEAFRLDLRPVVEGKSLAADVILQPDDVIYVPQTFLTHMEHFIDQFFGGLLPIPTLFRETYEAIYIRDLAIFRRPVVVGPE
jgi:polysaccharide export outer membrane protein